MLPILGPGAGLDWEDRVVYPVLDLGQSLGSTMTMDRLNAIRWQQGIHRPAAVGVDGGFALRLPRAPWHLFTWGPSGSSYTFVRNDARHIETHVREEGLPQAITLPGGLALGSDGWVLPGQLDIDSAAMAVERLAKFGGRFAVRADEIGPSATLPSSEFLTLLSPRFGLLYARRQPAAVFTRPPGRLSLRTHSSEAVDLQIVGAVPGGLKMGRGSAHRRRRRRTCHGGSRWRSATQVVRS